MSSGQGLWFKPVVFKLGGTCPGGAVLCGAYGDLLTLLGPADGAILPPTTSKTDGVRPSRKRIRKQIFTASTAGLLQDY